VLHQRVGVSREDNNTATGTDTRGTTLDFSIAIVRVPAANRRMNLDMYARPKSLAG
jgi:hypothetical protein